MSLGSAACRLAWLLSILSLLATSASAGTHRLKPRTGHPTFALREPVLTVKPGDVLESETLWGEWYEKAGGLRKGKKIAWPRLEDRGGWLVEDYGLGKEARVPATLAARGAAGREHGGPAPHRRRQVPEAAPAGATAGRQRQQPSLAAGFVRGLAPRSTGGLDHDAGGPLTPRRMRSLRP